MGNNQNLLTLSIGKVQSVNEEKTNLVDVFVINNVRIESITSKEEWDAYKAVIDGLVQSLSIK